ncbi:hypothetical protein GCM10022277_08880 [Litoribacillus peritrichatus]|uniref:Cadherin domain-containing protein n=2 Tax=Litoribacillus peritrichatus TaxID=718191 RepID=A0ABP7MAV3_9GAMM
MAEALVTFDLHQHDGNAVQEKALVFEQGDLRLTVTAQSSESKSAQVSTQESGLGVLSPGADTGSEEVDSGEQITFEFTDIETGQPVLVRVQSMRLKMFEPNIGNESAEVNLGDGKPLRVLNRKSKKRYDNVAGYGKDRHLSSSWLMKTNYRVEGNFALIASPKSQFYIYDLVATRINLPPVFTSEPVTSGTEGVEYRYQPLATDEKAEVSYHLENRPYGMTIDASTGEVQWVPGFHDSGQHQITVVATDQEGAIQNQSFDLTIANVNRSPVIQTQPLLVAKEGVAYQYKISATDADHELLFYRPIQAPAGMTFNEVDRTLRWTPNYGDAGDYVIKLGAADHYEETIQQFTLNVLDDNRTPSITSTAIVTGEESKAYAYQVSALDLDQDSLVYSLEIAPEGMAINERTGLIQWVPDFAQAGKHQVKVLVKDNKGAHSNQSFDVVIQDLNRAPEFVSQPPLSAKEHALYEYALRATDADGQGLTYQLLNGPEGMSLAEGHQLSWMPDYEDSGVVNVRVAVSDGIDSTEQDYNLVVENTNLAPVILTALLPEAVEGQPYRVQIESTDPFDQHNVTYQLLNAPNGMTINRNSGLISWSPQFDQAGTHQLNVRVRDQEGAIADKVLKLNVENKNYAPKFLSLPLVTVAEGSVYRYHLKSQDPDRDGVTYRIVQGPEGLRLEDNTLYWQPDFEHAGDYPVEVEVTDGDLTAKQSFAIQVTNTNRHPEILSEAVLQAKENAPYQYQVLAKDADQQPLAYRLVKAPEGMAINPQTGLIEWLPSFNQAGEVFVVINVSDPEKAETLQQFSISVADTNQSPKIVSEPQLTVAENTQWRYPLMAEDADVQPLTHQVTAGPEGMTLDSFNTLSWYPGFSAEGVYPVAISVSDGLETVDQTFELKVLNTNQLPVIQSQPNQQAKENEPYSYQVLAEDKDGETLRYQLTKSPNGMTIDTQTGFISWTPDFEQAGAHPVEVMVTDQHLEAVHQLFAIDVMNINRPPVFESTPITVAEVGLPYRYEVNALDPDADDLVFTLQQAPMGMVFNPQQRTVFWHPDMGEAGSYDVTLTVSDGEREIDHTFVVVVAKAQNAEITLEEEAGNIH